MLQEDIWFGRFSEQRCVHNVPGLLVSQCVWVCVRVKEVSKTLCAFNSPDAGLIQILSSVQYFTKRSAPNLGLLESVCTVQRRERSHVTTYLVLYRLTTSGHH